MIIAERYEVIKSLGRGIMGEVYACKQLKLEGPVVAVKVIVPELVKNAEVLNVLKNAIFASYNVSHSNVLRAHEYFHDGDLVLYAMEYLKGGNLADKLDNTKGLMLQDVLRILKQVCAGVGALHGVDLLYQNIKASNILFTEQGEVKIADFWNVSALKEMKPSSYVFCTDYIPPETLFDSKYDKRSDVYALGLLAYEMLTGKSPFWDKRVYNVMKKRLDNDIQGPSLIRSDCPMELEEIVLKALAKEPDGRYQSPQEMQTALEALAI